MRNLVTAHDRAKSWSELVDKARGLTDRDGTPLDEEIVETVVGLWAHGVETSSSCSGHLSSFPFVWICALSDEEIAALDRAGPVDRGRLDECARQMLVAQPRAIELLDEFYRDRHVNAETMLVTANVHEVCGFYLRSQGAPLLSLRDREERERFLFGLGAEMRVFGEFLRVRFLAEAREPKAALAAPCFFGRFPVRIDDERRFALPSEWIAETALARHDLRFVLLPKLIEEAVSLVTARQFERIRAALDADGNDWWLVTPDRDGRIALPAEIAIRLGCEATLVGVDERIELWPSEELGACR